MTRSNVSRRMRATASIAIPKWLSLEWRAWRRAQGRSPQDSHVALWAFMSMNWVERGRWIDTFHAWTSAESPRPVRKRLLSADARAAVERAAGAVEEAIRALFNEGNLGASEAGYLLKEAHYRIERVLGAPPPAMELEPATPES
jgi:hypothetical protein